MTLNVTVDAPQASKETSVVHLSEWKITYEGGKYDIIGFHEPQILESVLRTTDKEGKGEHEGRQFKIDSGIYREDPNVWKPHPDAKGRTPIYEIPFGEIVSLGRPQSISISQAEQYRKKY